MKSIVMDFWKEEEGVGLVEYALLIGILGFAMFQVWDLIKISLIMSYAKILRTIRDMKYP